MNVWSRCGHEKTPENTSGKQCRQCKRARERKSGIAERVELEACTSLGRRFMLDRDGKTREDRLDEERMVQGSRKLAQAVIEALAA